MALWGDETSWGPAEHRLFQAHCATKADEGIATIGADEGTCRRRQIALAHALRRAAAHYNRSLGDAGIRTGIGGRRVARPFGHVPNHVEETAVGPPGTQAVDRYERRSAPPPRVHPLAI